MIVPSAHIAAAAQMVSAPVTETWPEPPSPDSRATPPSPSSRPPSGARPSRAWLSPASMPSSHSGTVATSSAAIPDGTLFSPTPTTPLATSSRTPTTPAPIHSASLAGQRRTLRRAIGNRMIPATRFRAAAISSGGIVSTPIRMARYVLPHTTQTISRHTQATKPARRTGRVLSFLPNGLGRLHTHNCQSSSRKIS